MRIIYEVQKEKPLRQQEKIDIKTTFLETKAVASVAYYLEYRVTL